MVRRGTAQNSRKGRRQDWNEMKIRYDMIWCDVMWWYDMIWIKIIIIIILILIEQGCCWFWFWFRVIIICKYGSGPKGLQLTPISSWHFLHSLSYAPHVYDIFAPPPYLVTHLITYIMLYTYILKFCWNTCEDYRD